MDKGWPCPKCGTFQYEYEHALREAHEYARTPVADTIDPEIRVCLNTDCGYNWKPKGPAMADRLPLVILFHHHNNDEVTRQNWESFKRHESDKMKVVAFHLKGCDTHLPESVEVSPHSSWPMSTDHTYVWNNADLVYLNWFLSPHRIIAHHYAWIEWDCYCVGDPWDFYRPYLEKYHDLVAADIRQPIDRWPWFKQIDRLPAHAKPHPLGVAPLAGVLVSWNLFRAIDAYCTKTEWNEIFSEFRLASQAKWLGAEISRGMRWTDTLNSDHVHIDKKRDAIYHPVKRIVD